MYSYGRIARFLRQGPPPPPQIWKRYLSNLHYIMYVCIHSGKPHGVHLLLFLGGYPPRGRSWLQDTLKTKLVDFAWNRRFFYLPGACSPYFG